MIHGVHHQPFENRGTVLRFEPPKSLRYSHKSSLSRLPDLPESFSVFDFALRAVNEGTRLTLTLSGFPTPEIEKHLDFYWRVTLGILQRFVEARAELTIAGGLCRRAATEADVPFLIELRRQTMTVHQLASGVTPSDEERRRRVLVRYECAEIILQGTRPVGLLKVARDASDWELMQIQLIPELQGHGIGSELIGSLALEAEQAGASLRLWVLNGNPARRLYQRMGFTVVGENEHALEMLRPRWGRIAR